MADLGTDVQEREKGFILASHQGRFLYHIDQALRRINDKTYGKCETCAKSIGLDRLSAVPHARFCFECKSVEESGKS